MWPAPLFAVCVFEIIGGWLYLDQKNPDSSLRIRGNLTGLVPGKHGFHFHKLGDTLENCTQTGPHFNPWRTAHGGPEDEIRHVGDLGNIEANENGTVNIDVLFDRVSLYYPTLYGRSIVIHADADDEGRGENATSSSQDDGNPGPAIDCCGIARVQRKLEFSED